MFPYEPINLPPDNIDWISLIPDIGESNAALADYNGILRGIINPSVLLSPIMDQEAVLSSKIEGTQASLEEVLDYEAGSDIDYSEDKRDDIDEILNYRRAMNEAVVLLKDNHLTINFIRDIHRILLTSVRGKDKEPGEIRKIQNFIGPYGASIDEASFVPPMPIMVWNCLSDWERYLHTNERDPLVQLAILKAQFELIHPFRDGNGRIGRMLVPLILYYKRKLSSPMFYISSYLERNRDEYYHALKGISQNDDWNTWISFFLKAIIEQAKENSNKAQKIILLYDEMKQVVPNVTHSQHSIQTIDAIFSRPWFQSTFFITKSGIPKKTASRILQELVKAEILRVVRQARGNKPAVYMFPRMFEITENVKIIKH